MQFVRRAPWRSLALRPAPRDVLARESRTVSFALNSHKVTWYIICPIRAFRTQRRVYITSTAINATLQVVPPSSAGLDARALDDLKCWIERDVAAGRTHGAIVLVAR